MDSKKIVDAGHCGSDLCNKLGTRNVYNQCSCNCPDCRQADQIEKRQKEFDKKYRSK